MILVLLDFKQRYSKKNKGFLQHENTCTNYRHFNLSIKNKHARIRLPVCMTRYLILFFNMLKQIKLLHILTKAMDSYFFLKILPQGFNFHANISPILVY